jgi:uncharacterized protein (TIGR00255 family)
MALSSMTGFARAEGALSPWSWFWEAKSVNGRSLEIRLRLPPGLDNLEVSLRALAQKHFKRGNLQMTLTLDRLRAGSALKLNREALAVALAALDEIAKERKFGPADPASLLAIKGILEAGDDEIDEALSEERDGALLASADKALQGLRSARLAEGAEIRAILAEQLRKIAALAEDASARAADQLPKFRERVREQVRLLLESRQGLPEERLAQELALIAVKTDVREEIDRLQVHVRGGGELLASADAVGRRLDFLTQEMNREANTICSKANDVALTQVGLELKAVIDQMREQVQNVE